MWLKYLNAHIFIHDKTNLAPFFSSSELRHIYNEAGKDFFAQWTDGTVLLYERRSHGAVLWHLGSLQLPAGVRVSTWSTGTALSTDAVPSKNLHKIRVEHIVLDLTLFWLSYTRTLQKSMARCRLFVPVLSELKLQPKRQNYAESSGLSLHLLDSNTNSFVSINKTFIFEYFLLC